MHLGLRGVQLTEPGLLACCLAGILAQELPGDRSLDVLRGLDWRPADPAQVECALQGLRRLDDPFAASVRQELGRYADPPEGEGSAGPARDTEAAILAAFTGGSAARGAATKAFEDLLAASGPDRVSFEVSRFHVETGDGTTLVVGGPEGTTERLGILVTEAFQLSLDERNAQLNWMHSGVLQFHLGLDRTVWPLPIAEDDCADYRRLYAWDIAPLGEEPTWLLRLRRADRPGLEQYLRVHGEQVFVPTGSLLFREGLLKKAGFLTWGCVDERSAALVPSSYLGFHRSSGTTSLERWTIRDASVGFRADDIRLEVPEGLALWDFRTQEHHRFGTDPARWPNEVLERVRTGGPGGSGR